MKENKIHIYTDGSCLGNPGPGGWGVVILIKDKQHELKGGEADSTNNRMEMTAVIKALSWLQKKSNISEKKLSNSKISIHSDSNLIVQTMNQGWKRKANTDLWAKIDKLRAWLNITWIWVKAHADNKYNNQADQLALNEATKQKNKK
ncbi:ribonuclease H [Patescibacteria group bacterium]